MALQISAVTFEHHAYRESENIGIGTASPRISWKFEGTVKNWIQKEYEIEITRYDGSKLEFYRVVSQQSLFIPWPSSPLKSRETTSVRVRVSGELDGGVQTPWSKSVTVEAGLLKASDWACGFVESHGFDQDPNAPHRPMLFRREFKILNISQVKKATLYITAHGIYEAQVNTRRVGDHVLAPGWTEYSTCLTYQTHNVTELLQKGKNVLGIEVGEGWYCGRIGIVGGRRNIWGDRVGAFAQLMVDYEDGITEVIGTDYSWRWSPSATLLGEIYDGEKYDAREQQNDWSSPNFDASSWKSVRVSAGDYGLISAPTGPPIRNIEEVSVQSVLTSKNGNFILDFGQNLVGWVRVRAKGKKGQTITLRHAEVLEHGEICTRTLRFASATDCITLSGEPLVWEPKFTFHGYRYVQVDISPSYGEVINPNNFTAVVIHTDMERTGWFSCSEPMLNKLHSNILWSMKGNFVGIPTDCPQRDERLGYTGDLQAFATTGVFLHNTYGMLQSWLKSVAADQARQGRGIPPMASPNFARDSPHEAFAIWGDAVIMVPWELYISSGDPTVFADQYESMRSWLERGVTRDSRYLWDPTMRQLGDWLDPLAPPGMPDHGQTDSQLVANAFLIKSTDLMVEINTILGQFHEAAHYRLQAIAMRKQFRNSYLTPSGRCTSDSQTGIGLCIHFSLFASDTEVEAAGYRLNNIIHNTNLFKIATGFAGTPIIGHALTATNQTQVFYRMLMEKSCPSWLYPITMGATTIWERWDAMSPDGTVGDDGMTSFNHYALGAVGNWMHENIGGLKALEPGWKKVLVKPTPGGPLKSAEITHIGPYGTVEVKWELDHDDMAVQVRIPPNSTARVELPGQPAWNIGSGWYEYHIPYVKPEWPPQQWPHRPDDEDADWDIVARQPG